MKNPHKTTPSTTITLLSIILMIAGTTHSQKSTFKQSRGYFHPSGDLNDIIDQDSITAAESLLNNILHPTTHFTGPHPQEHYPEFNHLKQNQDAGYHPLKVQIEVDAVHFDRLKADNPQKYAEITEQYIPMLKQLLAELFSVKERRLTTFGKTSCIDYPLPSRLRNGYLEDADSVLYVKLINEHGVASLGGACNYHPDSGRPVAGILWLNPNSIKHNQFYWEPIFALVVREALHALGFGVSFMDDFRDPDNNWKRLYYRDVYTTIYGEYQFAHKLVIERAKKHFQCPSLELIPLETGGVKWDSVDFWDSVSLGDDIMTDNEPDAVVISDLTLAYFEASGWYKPDYRRAGLWTYGYHTGCEFVKGDFTNSPYKCFALREVGCNMGGYKKGECKDDKNFGGLAYSDTNLRTDDCRSAESAVETPGEIVKEAGEIFGFGSRCLSGYLPSGVINHRTKQELIQRGFCYASACEKQGDAYIVKFEIQDKNGQKRVLSCSKSGERVEINKNTGHYVECPHIPSFCFGEDRSCKNDCSLNGRCTIKGACECYFGWGGSDCSVKNGPNLNLEAEYPDYTGPKATGVPPGVAKPVVIKVGTSTSQTFYPDGSRTVTVVVTQPSGAQTTTVTKFDNIGRKVSQKTTASRVSQSRGEENEISFGDDWWDDDGYMGTGN